MNSTGLERREGCSEGRDVMEHTIKLAALGAVAFMVLDGVWLGVLMKNVYRATAGERGAARYTALIRPRGPVLPDYNAYQQELLRAGGRVA
jgi:hypothetical protein